MRFGKVKTPVYLQFSETECGIASLAMVFAYYKNIVPLHSLREKTGASRDGCKASTLMRLAKDYGYRTESYSVDISELKLLRQPVIAYWNFSHYVVINGFSGNKVSINDPACGHRLVDMDEFDKSFTGIIIVITPTKNIIRQTSENILFKLFRQWIKKYYKEILFIMICLLISAVIPLLQTNLSTLFINYCIIYSNQDWIPWLCAILTSLMMCLCITDIYQKYKLFQLCATESMVKSAQIIQQSLVLPLQFYALNQKSFLIIMLSRAEIIINSLLKNIGSISTQAILILVCSIFMATLDTYLFFTSMILILLTMQTGIIIQRRNLENDKSRLHFLGKWHAHTLSLVRNKETINACGLESGMLANWRGLYHQKLNLQQTSNYFLALSESINGCFSSIATFAIFVMGGMRIAQGHLSIGHLMGYFALHSILQNNLTSIIQVMKDWQEAQLSYMRIHDLFQRQKDERFLEGKIDARIMDQPFQLNCQQIYFYYNKLNPKTALQNINITIASHQHIAIVGKTGSGKSTLAKLLCGLYQPDEGEITLNHTNIRDLSAASLSKSFAYLSQDVALFAGTIHENLVLWAEDVSPDLIKTAIEVACLRDLIAARGLYGKVEENGSNFSGGERQRIEIARAIIQNTPILILDEATSALDIHTEAKIIANLRQLNKTIVFIAHRLSTIKHCDNIYVLENGKLMEQGNHAVLYAKKLAYYHLLQLEEKDQAA